MNLFHRVEMSPTPTGGRALSKLLVLLVLLAALVTAALFSGASLFVARTIHELLTESEQLKTALANLTQEDQIGYARVVQQERRDGATYTTLRFVETARGDKTTPILRKEFTIEGAVVYFDALIVKFKDDMVMGGQEKALYLWRRVYGEKMTPAEGFAIEEPGAEPRRYEGLLAQLHASEREMFWDAVWDLAHDPDRLRDYGIVGIYGTAVYSQLRPGMIYVFKISPGGQVYIEAVPDI